MSLCNICPDPGACCREMVITLPGEREPYQHSSLEYANTWFEYFPQVASRINESSQIVFTCPLLSDSGRCKDYDNRPEMCKNYKPTQDPLCVFHGKIRESELGFTGEGVA